MTSAKPSVEKIEMIDQLSKRLFLVLILVLSITAQAQQQPPLILDEEDDQSRVRVKKIEEQPADSPADAANPDAEEVDPKDILIAIVNSRVLTKAELDARISNQYQMILNDVQSEIGGVLANIAPGENLSIDLRSEKEVLDEQREQIERAIRKEEREAVKDWLDFSILAEEARRQNIIVTEQEFRQRLSQIEEEHMIDDTLRNRVLRSAQMSQEEYERYVYDALMIDKMVNVFYDLNYTEEDLQRIYENRPFLFYKPARYRCAHFTVAFEPDASRRDISARRADARKVRSLLRDNENPEKIFTMPEFDQTDLGMAGVPNGWYNLEDGQLPPQVEHTLKDMKVGEVSEVIENKARNVEGEIYLRSLHVLKLLEFRSRSGLNFETARNDVEQRVIEFAQDQLLERVRNSGAHSIIYRMNGIKPETIPSREELLRQEANAQPISLRLPNR